MNTDTIDTFLIEAGIIVGGGAFSARLGSIADAWAIDKAALLATSSTAVNRAALMRCGQLRIRQTVEVVSAATAQPNPPI